MSRPTAARMGARSVSCALVLVAATLTMAFTPPWTNTSPVKQLLLRPAIDVTRTVETGVDVHAVAPSGQISRWNPWIAEASRRFGVPKAWIRAVVNRESGGRTVTQSGAPITSRAGAMGLMQLMPDTYDEMRLRYGLGADPYDPHDNILAGTAYLAWLRTQYGYPNLFAAYNHGPGNFARHLQANTPLPRETRDYVLAITANLQSQPATRVHMAAAHRRHRANEMASLRLATL